MTSKLLLAVVSAFTCVSLSTCQSTPEYISENLKVKFQVLSNFDGENLYFRSEITLTNSGTEEITQDGWLLYFMSIHMIEYEQELWKNSSVGYEIPNSGFKVYHVAGGLFKFEPTASFQGIPAGESSVFTLKIQNWNVARTDNMPNWYVTDENNGNHHIIESTATEDLSKFIGEYDTEEKWKRYKEDRYNPWTPQQRYDLNKVDDLKKAGNIVLPTPSNVVVNEVNGKLPIPLSGWGVTFKDGLENEADLLKEKLKLQDNAEKNIALTLNSTASKSNEGYTINIDGNGNTITISSPSAAGIYYGSQTLISIIDTDSEAIDSMTIEDCPRYGYRGMHVDVARHFVAKNDIIKLIEVMGMYKLNKLHLHLTDDEGWRVEMDWCPPLTTVGATQCHDPGETSCQYPQFGSKADKTGAGSGFYTIADYKEILAATNRHHIEVIPEVDLPGHARAAIKAVEAFSLSGNEIASSIQLRDPNDLSVYLSVQLYTDNAVDPCLNTTYEFVTRTVRSFVEYHKDIQPLKVMHLGGDEVAEGAWINSTACRGLDLDREEISEGFVKGIGEKLHEIDPNLSLGLWEDGAITKDEKPFDRSIIAAKEVLVNSWQNVWEWGVASRAYKLANAGYKVVMSQATHLYFDFPEEPDPEERGFYWGTRFSNTRKTFSFKPDDLYSNIDTDRAGNELTREDVCKQHDCTELEKPENILGIQGQVWTETMRTPDHFFGAVFPRLLALAERAWHKATWETKPDKVDENEDWKRFANTLGHKELRRLDDMKVPYRVPVPGATNTSGQIEANSEFPGLSIKFQRSGDDVNTWEMYENPIKDSGNFVFQVQSADGERSGRSIRMGNDAGARANLNLICAVMAAIANFAYLSS